MQKPNGIFVYPTGLIAGAGGAETVNCFTQADLNGDTLKATPAWGAASGAGQVVAWFVPQVLTTAASNPGRVRVTKTPTAASGILTGLSVTLTNDSPAAGDSLSGTLYVRVLRRENI